MSIEVREEGIVTRVTNLPVVSLAVERIGAWYGGAKKAPLLGHALRAAENAAGKAVQVAQPVVNRLPTDKVDSILCRTLDTLEAKVPLVKETPDEMLLRSKVFVSENATALKESFQSRVASVQQSLSDKATAVSELRMVQAVVVPVKSGLDSAISISENAVEYFLPENTDDEDDDDSDDDLDDKDEDDDADEESSNKDSKDKTGYVSRVGIISQKLRKRLYKRALQQIRHAQTRTKEALEKLKFNVDLIQYAEENLGYPGKVISQSAKTTQAAFWAVVSPDEEGEGEGEGDEDTSSESGKMADSSKAVSVVRYLAKRVRGGYQAMARATEYLPSGLHTLIDSVKQGAAHTMELLHVVSQLKSQPGEDASTLSRISNLVGLLLAASEYVGQRVSSLLKSPQDDEAEEFQSSTQFTVRASWPLLKKSNKPPSLDTAQSEDEEMEEDDDEDKRDSDN